MFWLKRYVRNLFLCRLLLGLLGLTSGCAGIHLYNAGEHQLAQKAQTTLADAKLGNRLDSQRERIRDISTKDPERPAARIGHSQSVTRDVARR